MRFVFALLMTVGWLVSGVPAWAAGGGEGDVVSVRVKGMGMDRESALRDALRKAIERGGHLEIYSRSETENYTLVHDTVLAQTTGLVRDYKVLSEGEDPLGGNFVELTARIDRKIIDATWGQVQILLKQMGRPKILVNIAEKINDLAIKRETIEEAGLLESKVESLLVEKGFEVVDKTQVERLKRVRLDQASMSGDTDALRRLATELGAEMFVTGFARASGPQVTDAYGVPLYMWETDVTLKAVWAETAQVLFNRNETGTRGGSRTPGPPGAKDAIAKSGEKMAHACLQGILEKWSRQAVGGGKVILEVRGLEFNRALMIQDGLGQIQGVREVRREWHKPVAKFEIITVHTAEKFAELLATVQFQGFVLEVVDQKFNTLIADVRETAEPVTETQPATKEASPAAESQPATQPSSRPAATQPTPGAEM